MNTSPFIHNDNSVQKIMFKVQLATLPALAVHTYFFGFGITVQWMLGLITLFFIESIMLKMRGRPVIPFVTDLSGVVSVTLLVFCLPPEAPWWVIVTGVSFSMIFGKHLFGRIR